MVIQLWHGDCLERLKGISDGVVSAIVADPPYEIFFMSKNWDGTGIAYDPRLHAQLFRILQPGGLIRVFSATRTYHRVVRAVRQAGFEDVQLRAWNFGSGFPKSTNISKQLDKQAGAERKVIGTKKGVGGENLNDIVNEREVRQTTDKGGKGVGAYGTGARQVSIDIPITEAATELAKQWEGYGTALKPAFEPVVCGRKPGGSLR